MPVEFQPQQAFNSQVAEGYGASLARQANSEFALKASAQAQQAGFQNSSLAQNDAHFHAQLAQQGQLENARENNQQSMLSQQMQHGFDINQQKANIEFTQADNLRLQRLNQDAAGWDTLHSSGEIDDQEYAQGRQMIAQQQMPMQARRQAAEQARVQQEAAKTKEQTAALTAINNLNANFDANNSAGTIRHISDDGTGEDLGPHQWDRHNAKWVPLRTGGTSSGSSGTSGGGGRGSVDIARITNDVMSMKDPATGAPVHSTPQAIQEQIDARVRAIEGAQQAAQERAQEQARLRPGGPPVFDPLPRGVPPANHTEDIQQGLLAAARRADGAGGQPRQTDRSQTIRALAGALRQKNPDGTNVTTGQLSPDQQQTLAGIPTATGRPYYNGDFTPALDRELGRIETGGDAAVAARAVGTLAGATVNTPVAPATQMAARGVRNLLGQYGTLEAMPPIDRQAFQNHLATIRVFNWGMTGEERASRRRGADESPATPGAARTPRPTANTFGLNVSAPT